jgi:hypothetical protein
VRSPLRTDAQYASADHQNAARCRSPRDVTARHWQKGDEAQDPEEDRQTSRVEADASDRSALGLLSELVADVSHERTTKRHTSSSAHPLWWSAYRLETMLAAPE